MPTAFWSAGYRDTRNMLKNGRNAMTLNTMRAVCVVSAERRSRGVAGRYFGMGGRDAGAGVPVSRAGEAVKLPAPSRSA